jgi:hypothetical protein
VGSSRRSSMLAGVRPRVPRATAHRRLRVKLTTKRSGYPAARRSACAISAEAKRSTSAPASIFSRIRPDGPNSGGATVSGPAGNRRSRSLKAAARLPAPATCNVSADAAGMVRRNEIRAAAKRFDMVSPGCSSLYREAYNAGCRHQTSQDSSFTICSLVAGGLARDIFTSDRKIHSPDGQGVIHGRACSRNAGGRNRRNDNDG